MCVVKKSDLCKGDGVLVDGECTVDLGNFRVDDPLFVRQSLQTGETISPTGTFTSMLVGSLGPILIVFFITIYAVKKRKKSSKNIKREK